MDTWMYTIFRDPTTLMPQSSGEEKRCKTMAQKKLKQFQRLVHMRINEALRTTQLRL